MAQNRRNGTELRSLMELFCKSKFPEIEELFNELTNKEKIYMWLEVSKIVVPRRKEIDLPNQIDEETEQTRIELNEFVQSLSPENVAAMYEKAVQLRDDANQKELMQPLITNLEYSELKKNNKPF